MNIKQKRSYKMDVLFPIVLFLVFTLSALFVILFAARTYQHTIEDSEAQYQENTTLSYLTQKLRQADISGEISVGEFDGCPALILRQTYDDVPYVTYIYAYDHSMRELFIAEGEDTVTAAGGTAIFAAEAFNAEFVNDHLLSVAITDANGDEKSAYVSIRSSAETP